MNNPNFHIGFSHNENWTNWYCTVGYFTKKGIILNCTVAISLWKVNNPKLHNPKKKKKIWIKKKVKIVKKKLIFKSKFKKKKIIKRYLNFDNIQNFERN